MSAGVWRLRRRSAIQAREAVVAMRAPATRRVGLARVRLRRRSEEFVAFHDLLDLFQAAFAEGDGDEGHGGVALGGGHVTEGDAGAGDHDDG